MTSDHLDKQTSFFYFGKTWPDFSCKERGWNVRHILIEIILCCTITIIYITYLFSYSKQLNLSRNILYLYHVYLKKKDLSDIVTIKKYFALVIYVILSDSCPGIMSRWYKTILNQVEWTCKVKKNNKINNFWQ